MLCFPLVCSYGESSDNLRFVFVIGMSYILRRMSKGKPRFGFASAARRRPLVGKSPIKVEVDNKAEKYNEQIQMQAEQQRRGDCATGLVLGACIGTLSFGIYDWCTTPELMYDGYHGV
jgi:hypothetical protein